MKVLIVDYNPEWPARFAEERDLLARAINIDGAMIEHIGSTSVVGLTAKPVIDIMVGLPDFAAVEQLVPRIEVLGYDYIAKYNAIMPYRRFFTKKLEGLNTHNLHMVETGCEFWERHLLFRDYLRKYPEVAAAYAEHKQELAEREWQDVNEYAYAKTEFITKIEQQAMLERRQ